MQLLKKEIAFVVFMVLAGYIFAYAVLSILGMEIRPASQLPPWL